MKKRIIIYLLFVTGILMTSCTSGTAKESVNEKNLNANPNKIENKMGTIALNKADFLAKVANFEENPSEWKYLGDQPCIIDFYADWCGPCKMVAPILEELAAEYQGKIRIYKIDTEKEQELAAVFGIRSIPSILFVPMEGKPQMAQGAMPKASFREAIREILLKEQE